MRAKRCGDVERWLDGGFADGAPSAHFEHTVLVTDGDAEILTWLRKSPYESKAR